MNVFFRTSPLVLGHSAMVLRRRMTLSRMLKLGAGLWTVALLLGCASPNEPELPVQDGSVRPEDVGTILIPDADLANSIEVVQLKSVPAEKNCITAVVQFRNKGSGTLHLQSRYLFKNSDGFTKEISPWVPQTVETGAQVEFKVTSTISGTSRFILQLESAKK